jgi:RimJ/RimL family protein N-acetyltransferase
MDDPLDVELRDGTAVRIRPIRPEDRPQLAEGFAQLSDRSRYLRFHTVSSQLTDEQLRYLTEVDQVDHIALVAVLRDDPQVGLGVARAIRLPGEPTVAEAAVTVADQWQGRALGTLLLGALGTRARRQGIEVFRSYVLAENTGMLALFEELGAERASEGDGAYRVDLRLPSDAGDLPDTPAGRVLRAVATGRLPTLDPKLPPIWRRDRERGDLAEWLDKVLGRAGRS